MLLREKQQKNQHYHQVTLINMNIYQVNKSDKSRTIEKAKFTYSPLGKGFKTIEETIEEQIETIEQQQEQQKKTSQNFKCLQTLYPKINN